MYLYNCINNCINNIWILLPANVSQDNMWWHIIVCVYDVWPLYQNSHVEMQQRKSVLIKFFFFPLVLLLLWLLVLILCVFLLSLIQLQTILIIKQRWLSKSWKIELFFLKNDSIFHLFSRWIICCFSLDPDLKVNIFGFWTVGQIKHGF